jgi:hypothetical protein
MAAITVTQSPPTKRPSPPANSSGASRNYEQRRRAKRPHPATMRWRGHGSNLAHRVTHTHRAGRARFAQAVVGRVTHTH